jgi:hypothetical protein
LESVLLTRLVKRFWPVILHFWLATLCIDAAGDDADPSALSETFTSKTMWLSSDGSLAHVLAH